jgi:hypothetical protein
MLGDLRFAQRYLTKCSSFWDTMYSVESRLTFGGICRLHLQGRRIRQAKKPAESRWQDLQRITRRYIPEDGTLQWKC